MTMKIGIINSAWFGTPMDGRPGMDQTKALGFDTMDVFADPLELSDAARADLVRNVREVGLPIPSVVCVALGLGDFNNAPRAYHIERAKKHVDLARDLGAKNVLLVLGEYIWQREVIKPEDQWAMTAESTRQIGDYAAQHGIELALELEPFDESLVNTIDKMDQFLRDVGLENVKANVDCSHLWLQRIDASEIEKLRGRIAHVHISDCNGEVHGDLPPGRGNTPLLSYIEALRDVGYDGTVSLELEYSPEPAKIGEWVEEAYRETRKLMQRAGVHA
ncbi:sugar phosphate isomerase/epimerase family protein [Deinococcus sp.]|uniref:sugar phosphate isomerase/epimerase family protein n=1 Tax=Deinococcus sp. TaxID=47478 RepID=UPI003CC54B37